MEGRVFFIGTSDYGGIPRIACDCPVCKSRNEIDMRNRPSVYLPECKILINVPYEFRDSMVLNVYSMPDVKCVLLTSHFMHNIMGFDDIKTFTLRRPIPVFGSEETIKLFRKQFSYFFREHSEGGGTPNVETYEIKPRFGANDIDVCSFPVNGYSNFPVYGYRIKEIVCIFDCLQIPKSSISVASNSNILIINLIFRDGYTLGESVSATFAIIKTLRPQRAYVTQIPHDFFHLELQKAFDDLKSSIHIEIATDNKLISDYLLI